MVRVLSIHAGYACRHSGTCCSVGWRIPIEPGTRARIDEAARRGALPAQAARVESDGQLTVLALAADGATCTAFEPAHGTTPALCAIHRVLGSGALPTACRHFPRVCLLDPRGVSITLSHFCPTAAGLLFDDGPLAVMENPAGFADTQAYEGLDARDALPPLLRRGLLMDLASYAAWETCALQRLDSEMGSPEAAIAELARQVDRIRSWTPRDGPLLARVLAESGSDPVGSDPDIEPGSGRFCEVLECVPRGLAPAQAPSGLARIDREFVAPRWADWHRPLRRYLAARLHASWVPYQGHGLRTVVSSLSAALEVVRVEAARHCAHAERVLDRSLLTEAIRSADLLLVHEADRERLARTWSRAEDRSAI